MNKSQLLSMDSYILLSWINTKLRDEFDSIISLCNYYDVSTEDIMNKLKSIGYLYNRTTNQFIII